MNVERVWAEARQLHEKGRLKEAEERYNSLTRLNPVHPLPWYMLGCIRMQQGRLHAALDLIGHAAVLGPDNPMIAADYARALHDGGRTREALAALTELLAKAPGFVPALDYRGSIRLEEGNLGEALVDLDIVLKQHPDRYDLLFKTAVALGQSGRLEEALARYERLCAINPRDFHALTSRGWTKLQLGLFDSALSDLEQVTAMAPSLADGQISLGYYWMLMGDFGKGLPLMEWRSQLPNQTFVRDYPQPRWTGVEDIAGKILLIHSEQGLGDIIQFSRYLFQLSGTQAKLLFAIPACLHLLFQRASFPAVLCDMTGPLQSFDYHIPLMSLPLALGTRLATIPFSPSYLSAEPEQIARWADRVGEAGFRIGIAWNGHQTARSQGKSIPLALLEPIARLENVRLISLQKGEPLQELRSLPNGMVVEVFDDLDTGPHAFLDTAALMKCMDLIISIDSAPAHLAGALGVSTWVLLKNVPEWRWLLERDDTPWYPSMRLFRQPSRGDWPGVVSQILVEIGHLRKNQKLPFQ